MQHSIACLPTHRGACRLPKNLLAALATLAVLGCGNSGQKSPLDPSGPDSVDAIEALDGSGADRGGVGAADAGTDLGRDTVEQPRIDTRFEPDFLEDAASFSADREAIVDTVTPPDDVERADASVFAGDDAPSAPEDAASDQSPAAVDTGRDTLAAVPSSLLPILMIDVAGKVIGDSDKTAGVLKTFENHNGTLMDLAGLTPSLTTNIGIELRGKTTVPKKSYTLELRNSAGQDVSRRLLGLPSESDFALYGCYSDKTCVRDVMAYGLAREMGAASLRWAPRTLFVELFVDAAYQGLYVLVERIKQNPHRVDIPKPALDATTGDVTGGYIFKMEGAGEGIPSDRVARDWVSTFSGRIYSYHYPKFDKISPAQKFYLQGQMSLAELALRGSEFEHPVRGYPAYFDMESLVDFALMQELTVNVEGYGRSAYFHKLPSNLKGGRFVAGPVWDFDGALGNNDEKDGWKTDVWAYASNRFGTQTTLYNPPGTVGSVPAYWERIWGGDLFRSEAKCRWAALRSSPILSNESLTNRFSGWFAALAKAQPRDQARWKSIGQKIGHNYFVGTSYADEMSWLRTWILERARWMDTQLAAIPGACQAPGADGGLLPVDAGPDAKSAADAITPADAAVDAKPADATSGQ